MKTTVLLLTFASLSNLSAAESSQKQQVPEWTTAELEERPFPPIPKPRMVPTLQSLCDITFEKIYGKKEQYKPNIQLLVTKNDITQVHMFLRTAKKDISHSYLMDLLAKSQSKEMAELIIHDPRFNVHTKYYLDNTLLHDTKKSPEIVELLIAAGANVNAQNFYCDTPLLLNDSETIIELLINARADVNAKNDFGNIPLHFAKKTKIAQLLIAAGADVNAKNNLGSTPLHYANNIEVAQLFIAAGSNPCIQDCLKKFPYENFSQKTEIYAYLKQEYDKRMALMKIHKKAFAQIHAKRKD